ncbi:hypothetical protein CBR_g48398 [Chara braunii]|uniref:Uncharacterized protein n=1 Tax=Chara braunii TaxID=69332 RepID=A0A388M2K3_CHABU|nr:hypothetical protein CBR_g48398 [Chara braunii]|eukprot:GBG88781.1 hypothetical protein CBR_g48398 [Chara braunii]
MGESQLAQTKSNGGTGDMSEKKRKSISALELRELGPPSKTRPSSSVPTRTLPPKSPSMRSAMVSRKGAPPSFRQSSGGNAKGKREDEAAGTRSASGPGPRGASARYGETEDGAWYYQPLDASVRGGPLGSMLGLSKPLPNPQEAALGILVDIQRFNPHNRKAFQAPDTRTIPLSDLLRERQRKEVVRVPLHNVMREMERKEKIREANQRKKKSMAGRSAERMHARDHRRNGTFTIRRPEQLKFCACLRLHELWKEYMKQLIGTSRGLSILKSRLLNADRHGCFMSVVQAKNPSWLGCKGIVVKETGRTFTLVSPVTDHVKVVPKGGCVFSFGVEDRLFTMYGNNIHWRPPQDGAETESREGSRSIDL